jgi:hypothetical protein
MPIHHRITDLRLLLVCWMVKCYTLAGVAFLTLGMISLHAQGQSSVQQAQFRSQWVGEQVDRIPYGSQGSPFSGLGSIVGPLRTQDQVQREAEASIANLEPSFPITFKPSLGTGWEFSNQGTQSQGNSNNLSAGNSPFVAPALALLYDRDHGPWTLSGGYSAGAKYYSNPDYVGGGSGTQRNALSQTGFLNLSVIQSRYTLSGLLSGSSGSGYDFSSGSNNKQISTDASCRLNYILTTYTKVDAAAGVSVQNSSGSDATPNNTTGSTFLTITPVYELSEKTHLSAVVGAGSTSQSLQQGTTASGNAPTTNSTSSSMSYAQVLGKVKYDITGKISFDLALGERQVSSSQGSSANSSDTGLKPSWTFGLNYTPTSKTSVMISMGEQGTDVVPEYSLLLNWHPREKTSFSLGFSQTQAYASTLASQYQVSTGIFGTINQKLFQSVEVNLNAGYAQQHFVNLSSTQDSQAPAQSSSQIPSNIYMGQMTVKWQIRDSLTLVNALSYNTGQSGASSNQAQIWYAISLNFSL